MLISVMVWYLFRRTLHHTLCTLSCILLKVSKLPSTAFSESKELAYEFSCVVGFPNNMFSGKEIYQNISNTIEIAMKVYNALEIAKVAVLLFEFQ